MTKPKLILSLLLIVASCLLSNAQTYPIQTGFNLKPPSMPFLSSLSEQAQITLLLNESPDLQIPIYLRITLKSNALQLQTTNLPPIPILLTGGIPYTLLPQEILPYLSPRYLNYNSDQLPDGYYTITLQAIDYQRQIPLSAPTSLQTWLRLGKAPQLNFPSQNAQIAPLDQAPILFSWTLRDLSPNPQDIYYQFTLVEIPNSLLNTDPNQALFTLKPLYTTTTQNTYLNYDLSAPALTIGKKYAWRVQIKQPNNKEYYENQGYSEVFSFLYGSDCPCAQNIKTVPQTHQTIIQWEGSPLLNLQYQIRYRKTNTQTQEQWSILAHTDQNKQTTQKATIAGLTPDTEYEIMIETRCPKQQIKQALTNPEKFKTLAIDQNDPDSTFECGRNSPTLLIKNTNPLQSLMPGDTIYAADHTLIITKATQKTTGRFSGEAEMSIAFFNYAIITMVFENIQINTEKQFFSTDDNYQFYAAPKMYQALGIDEALLENIEQWNQMIEQWANSGLNALAALDQLTLQLEQWLQEYDQPDKTQLQQEYLSLKNDIKRQQDILAKETDPQKKREARQKLRKNYEDILKIAKKVIANRIQKFLKNLKEIIKEILQQMKKEKNDEKKDKEEKIRNLFPKIVEDQQAMIMDRYLFAQIQPKEEENENENTKFVFDNGLYLVTDEDNDQWQAVKEKKALWFERWERGFAFQRYYRQIKWLLMLVEVIESYETPEAIEALAKSLEQELKETTESLFQEMLKGNTPNDLMLFATNFLERIITKTMTELQNNK